MRKKVKVVAVGVIILFLAVILMTLGNAEGGKVSKLPPPCSEPPIVDSAD